MRRLGLLWFKSARCRVSRYLAPYILNQNQECDRRSETEADGIVLEPRCAAFCRTASAENSLGLNSIHY